MNVAARLRDAATSFLAALPDEHRATAVRRFDDEVERRTWFYWPAPRAGLALRDMDPDHQTLAHQLIADYLSAHAFAKVQGIIALERVLDEIEGRTGSGRGLPRDTLLYYVTIFGDPAGDAPWSLRFEGHHVSLHVACLGDDVRVTPAFLGANPATVRHDDRVVTRPLGEEEDVGRELVRSLDAGQRDRAVVSDDAPDDILTVNSPRLDGLPQDGLPAADMGAEQRRILETLVSVYVERARPELAGPEMDRIRELGVERIVFAWAGSTEPGERHYYRLAGPTFLAEYDNTQDDVNHIHAVWRDLEQDFGADLLRAHVAAERDPN
jgi:hypothetical protein